MSRAAIIRDITRAVSQNLVSSLPRQQHFSTSWVRGRY